MSLKAAITLLAAQGEALASKLQDCANAAAAARKTLGEAESSRLRRELDHLLGAYPGAVDTGRLLGRMEATAHLLRIVDERGAEALAAEFGNGGAKSPPE